MPSTPPVTLDRIASGAWFGPDDRSLAGWWSAPVRPTDSGVVIAPAIGYEWWSTHRTLRTLAERLADSGHLVLRFDYDGTGDSAGDRWDGDRVAAWRASLHHAVAAMRTHGIDHLTVVGLRFGGLLALLDGATLGADAIAAIAPVDSGRRFAKELRLLGIPVPGVEGAVVNAGLVVTPQVTADLGRLDLHEIVAAPARRVLVLARPETPADALVDRLTALGSDVTAEPATDIGDALGVATEDAVVPATLVDRVVRWIGPAASAAAPPRVASARSMASAERTTATIRIGDRVVRKSFVLAGDLVAVRTDPPDGPGDATVIFLDSGSEPHVGPGRAWVDYARAIAGEGISTLRIDYSGWGESPNRGHAPGRPYDRHCLDETAGLVDALDRANGPIVLAGLCAGAWMAMRAARTVDVAGIVAINPQLYWDFGDPIEATIAQTHQRRAEERRRIARGRRWGWWSVLDALGRRPMAVHWLSTLRTRRTRLLMLFSEDDDGLEYLEDRCGRALARERHHGYLEVEELGDLDHQMYREWRRPYVASRIAAFAGEVSGRASRPGGSLD